MSVRIQGDQAACFQLMPMVFEDTEDGLSHNLRSGTFDAKLNDAWKPGTLQRQHAGEIQILREDDRFVSARVIKYELIRIPVFSDIRPMGGIDFKRGENSRQRGGRFSSRMTVTTRGARMFPKMRPLRQMPVRP